MNTSDKLAWNSTAGDEARAVRADKNNFVPAHTTMLSLSHKLFILDHMTTLMIEFHTKRERLPNSLDPYPP